MIALQTAVELAANIVESYILISAALKIVMPHGTGKKFLSTQLCGTIFIFAIMSFLNYFSLFSFLTIFIIIFSVFLFAEFASRCPVLLGATGVILVFLTVHAVDYLSLSLLELIVGFYSDEFSGFSLFLVPGQNRIFYLFVDKGIDILLYVILSPHLSKIHTLPKKYQRIILLISCMIYTVMTVLLSLILGNSPATVRASVFISWIFLVINALMAVLIFWIVTNFQTEQETNRLLQMSNSMMDENYQNLHAIQKETSKRNHDFIHHIKLLRKLSAEGNFDEVQTYIDSLLSNSYQDVSLCHSGNDIIDAIINSKSAEAAAQGITFKYQINFSIPTNIQSIDLCSILANQIDNAIDACKLIPEPYKREIVIHIWQNAGNMAIFQVSNSVMEDPFLTNPKLHSTKENSARMHGLGIKSIEDSAAKYNGILESTFQNGKFVSTVLITYVPNIQEV